MRHYINTSLMVVVILFMSQPMVYAQASGTSSPPQDMIKTLWAGFDPRREPLEPEVLKTWNEDGIQLQELYFTGEAWQGEKVRVYAIQGAPLSGEGLPGVLHIHGGGQTASADWVRFWAKRGYVCVSFDYCGDWRKHAPDRIQFTRWGHAPGNMDGTDHHAVKPSPRFNPWYHWAIASRRALTLLEQHPQVDPKRLGVFGISMGGTLTWFVAGTDRRVKTAVPIYGCGWNSYQTPQEQSEAPVSADMQCFRKLLEADAYASLIRCPLLFLNASNDFHGNMDRSYATMQMTRSKIKRQAYTPQYNHHIEPTAGRDLAQWMDWRLKGKGEHWPETPRIEIKLEEQDIPQLQLRPDHPERVKRARIFYALDNPWAQSRFWRQTPAQNIGKAIIIAAAEVSSTTQVIYAFANVEYQDGIVLTSNLARVQLTELGNVHPTIRWMSMIDDMADETDWRYTNAYTDPLWDQTYFSPWTGPDGERGLTLNTAMWGDRPIDFNLTTNKLGDPQWRGPKGARLTLELWNKQLPRDFKIEVTEHDWQPSARQYTCEIKLRAGMTPWETLRLAPEQFKDSKGGPLQEWGAVDTLKLIGTSAPGHPPVLRNLRWTVQ